MTVFKTIICLANSRKLGERCVAGIEVANHRRGPLSALRDVLPSRPTRPIWVRPVSSTDTGELSAHDRQYVDGSEPDVLDIIRMTLIGPQPHRYQTENWLIDPDCSWIKIGQVGWKELLQYEERPQTLWVNGFSKGDGENNCVPGRRANSLTHSLKLIRVDSLALYVHYAYKKRVIDAQFAYLGHDYRLRVTDPVSASAYRAVGAYDLGEAFLTVSLGEPFYGYVYKLVAAIIEQP